MNKRNARSFSLPMSLMLLLLLTGCATKSPDLIPVQPPQTPALPPSLAKPVPPESFLERAQRNIEQWQKKLIEEEPK